MVLEHRDAQIDGEEKFLGSGYLLKFSIAPTE